MQDSSVFIDEMVKTVKAYGINDRYIIDAFRKVPRHKFLDKSVPLSEAYGDFPVQIGKEQTISQPFTVAFMLSLLELRKGHNVLEIGAGSGWNAALIEHIVGVNGSVTTVEYNSALAQKAKQRLRVFGSEVKVICKDGKSGYPQRALYDRIIVTCASPAMMGSWVEQLKNGGIIVAPVGKGTQIMIKAVKNDSYLRKEEKGSFRFVPLK
ncbi:MAG: protein-L-isoaspartate(D-aspartate) O-methyltransferase [Nanobdellota archaeon]